MYSGTTLTNKSGAIIGTHQKIDRVAYKYLLELIKNRSGFPIIKDILHFEGNNGPDAVKRKSPAVDEPWHYYDPFDEDDTQLLFLLTEHYKEFVQQLKRGEPERCAFDAAWIAHAVVDGLTPAHHFPYEQKLAEIRGGDKESRTTIADKLVMPGDTIKEKMINNWAMWGFGGLMSSHGFFELGIAAAVATLRFPTAKPSDSDIQLMLEIGFEEYFKRTARQIAMMDMYESFLEHGWRLKLIRDIRNELMPQIIKTVCLVWYCAMRDAGLLKGKS